MRPSGAALEARRARDALAGAVYSVALSEALCEAATDRLRALNDEVRKWQRRCIISGVHGELAERAALEARALLLEWDSVHAAVGRYQLDLNDGYDRVGQATLEFRELCRRLGVRLDPPAITDQMRREARAHVAARLDVEELISPEPVDQDRDFLDRAFLRLESRTIH